MSRSSSQAPDLSGLVEGQIDHPGQLLRAPLGNADVAPDVLVHTKGAHSLEAGFDDQLEDAVAVLDAFHVVKLGTQAVDDVRRRVQHETLGHRGRKGDPLYGIRTILRAGAENLTDGQQAWLRRAIEARRPPRRGLVAWQYAQQLCSVYHQQSPAEGRRIATKIIDSFPTCPIPEIARLGRTLRQWRQAFLAYFDTGRANNGGTEAINGSSSSTAASPAASATPPTTDSE